MVTQAIISKDGFFKARVREEFGWNAGWWVNRMVKSDRIFDAKRDRKGFTIVESVRCDTEVKARALALRWVGLNE